MAYASISSIPACEILVCIAKKQILVFTAKCGHFYGKNSATGYFRLELLRSPLGTVYSAMSRYKGARGILDLAK